MSKQYFYFIILASTIFTSCKDSSSTTTSGGVSTSTVSSKSGAHNLEVDLANIVSPIQTTMYGVFFEDINFGADGGLYPELIKNRNFEFENPMQGWTQPNSDRHSMNAKSGFASIVKKNENAANRNYLHVEVSDAKKYTLVNEGFRGIGVHQGKKYWTRAVINNADGKISKVIFSVVDTTDKVIGSYSFSPSGPWKKYEGEIAANATVEKAKLKITFEGNGNVDLDNISLYPQDNWGNRPNGLRKDIVQLLYDLKPGFLRFPGGCIVEGRTLNQRYQWKKTVGQLDKRETLINRWNTEFAHRLAPDYFQTFGLGFFEYFQLSEDIGAEPLPILSCGMACQFNTGELVPMDQLDPYVQDALDLIEFANGDKNSKWGKLRIEMGHEKPFNLKFIGVGNEQWGPEYFKRYAVFEKAIKSKYPSMKIVSGAGPFPEGEHFEYGNAELKKYKADLIDEHYYKPPQWFQDNATRYDKYDRNGAKIFAGEYAAQSVAIASPDNKNNWDCALSEAAFMTGLERNADVVYMTSYAPLMAHAEGWQWTPDLIWFNNLSSYGTPNYYVQKLFSNNRGTHLLKITQDGKPVVGGNKIFATAAKDSISKEIIFKIVNTSEDRQVININPKGGKIAAGKASVTTLMHKDKNGINSFDHPQAIAPISSELPLTGSQILVNAEPKSMTVVKVHYE